MFVRHEVEDYGAWRRVYDSIDQQRQTAGVTAQAVYRSIDDGNNVTASHDFGTAEQAHAFASSSVLREAMQRAGVDGAPEIWFTTPA